MTEGSRAHYRATFGVLALGVGAFALLQSLVIPVLTTVQHELHTTQDTVTWVLTAYLLSASIMTPILGRVGDMKGKKRVFVAALVALAVGSLLAALAPSIGVMIVARVIQGAGGGMVPVAFGIIRDEFPAEKVAGAVGILAALTAVGAGLGIVLAGPIVAVLNYHWLFWLPLILTVVATVCAVLLVPESPVRSPGRISWLPALLLSGWLVALLVALSEAPDWGWGSARVLGLLAAAVVLGAGWVLAELRATTPLIDMKMMRRTAVWTNNLVALLIGVGMYATFAFLPEFVQTPTAAGYGFGASITRSGLMLLPAAITMFVVGMFATSTGPQAGRQGSGHRRLPYRSRVDDDPRLRARAGMGDLPRHRPDGNRVRAGVLGDVRTDRRRRAALPDRRGQRHEREHPHDRRQHRRRRDGQHRHLAAGAVRAAEGVRLHDRLRGDGRRAGGGRAGRAADSLGPAAAAAGRPAGACRAGHGGGRDHRRRRERMTGRAAPARAERPARTVRRDAARNYGRILDAAREVLGESGADAGMEEIAARAGVGVGTVYRRFASKDALIGELLRLALADLTAATDAALTRTGGSGLEELLRAFGQSFADHARYATLFLERPADPSATRRIRAAIDELTTRAVAAGTVSPGTTPEDVMALVLAMRGLAQASGEVEPAAWERFLDIHLAGLRAAPPAGRRRRNPAGFTQVRSN